TPAPPRNAGRRRGIARSNTSDPGGWEDALEVKARSARHGLEHRLAALDHDLEIDRPGVVALEERGHLLAERARHRLVGDAVGVLPEAPLRPEVGLVDGAELLLPERAAAVRFPRGAPRRRARRGGRWGGGDRCGGGHRLGILVDVEVVLGWGRLEPI